MSIRARTEHYGSSISETPHWFDVKAQRIIGPGVVEDVYKVCLAHGLRLDGHKVLREVYLDLTYEGLCVPNAYKMGLVIDDKVVVEAKAIEKFSDASFASLNTYLTLSGLEVGLLLNFHNWPLKDGGIRRVVHTRT